MHIILETSEVNHVMSKIKKYYIRFRFFGITKELKLSSLMKYKVKKKDFPFIFNEIGQASRLPNRNSRTTLNGELVPNKRRRKIEKKLQKTVKSNR